MPNSNLKWYGKEVTRSIMNELGDRLEIAAIMLENEAKQNMSRTGGVSLPGEYPFKQTGHARRNITSEVNKKRLEGRWGTNVIYLKYLQLGTRSVQPRPWMTKTNQKMKTDIHRLLWRPV